MALDTEHSGLGAFEGATVVAPSSRPLRHRRVAIIGFGETAKQAPFDDPTWELWGMNGFHRVAQDYAGKPVPEERFSLWFDLHTVDFTRSYGQAAGIGDNQERWLEQRHPFPIFMLEAAAEFPSAVRFPIEEVCAAVGRDYFTSTIAYALGFCLMQPDVAEVGLWGIDLAHKTEYIEQRPCAEYLLGRLEASGVLVTVADRSALLTQRFRYGYEEPNPLFADMWKALDVREEGLLAEIAKLKTEVDQRVASMQTHDGALQLVREFRERLELYRRGGRV